jgi:TolB-like protein
MGTVFVSYAREDKRDVARLVHALREFGFDPWWDDDIPPGAGWEQTIERALADASAVIVCWTPIAVASENVRSEARVARAQNRLVQIFLDHCDPPLFFGERQGIDFSEWDGSADEPQMARLGHALRSVADAPIQIANPPSRVRPRRRRSHLPKAWIASTAAIVGAGGLAGWWWLGSLPVQATSRVAVLPISGLGGSALIESFADGLTDQMITSLNDGHIPTLSPGDSDSLERGDTDQKLKALSVGYTVSGTVERNGEMLHARLHLDDRARHSSLWSYEASGPVQDPAALNYAIAHNIAGVISCSYRALGPGGLTDTELLSRYLRVCDLFVNHDDAGDTKSTFELLEDLRQILVKAPDFTPAQSDFAKFAAYLAPTLPPDQASGLRAESAGAAKRALELDPHAADAYVAQEMLLPPTQWAQREALLRKAVSVNPGWPHSNGFLAILLTETGRMREAAIYGQRAAAADLQIDWKPFGAKMACDAGEARDIIPGLRERLSNSPSDADVKWALRWCLLDAGQIREAQQTEDPEAVGTITPGGFRQAAERALLSRNNAERAKALHIGSKLAASDPSMAPFVAIWSASLGDLDTAFRILTDFEPGHPTTGITDFLFAPQAEAMRRDPRFFTLMKRYKLAQFWRATGRWPDFCSGSRRASCEAAARAQP